MKYLVVIGDVVASRDLPVRAQFQRRLKQALQALNGRRKALASAYTLTLGDEFQAVYRDAGTAFADVFALQAELAPVQARFALAVGEIVTPINPAQAIGMDGPAFHRARALLETLKAKRRLLGVTPELGQSLKIDPLWAYNIVRALGNYGELYDRHFGPRTSVNLPRGPNRLWTEGGLIYALPLR